MSSNSLKKTSLLKKLALSVAIASSSCNLYAKTESFTFEDSFDDRKSEWSAGQGYTTSQGKNSSLQVQGNHGNSMRLQKALPSSCKIRFFMKMSKSNALAGFNITQQMDVLKESIQFKISGHAANLDPKSRGLRILHHVNGKERDILYRSSLEISNSQWKRVEIYREYSNFEIYFDGNFVTNFRLQGEPVYFELWGQGDQASLFDELSIHESNTISKDFSGKTLPFGNYHSKNWSHESGVWSKVYLPSLKTIALSQTQAQEARSYFHKKRESDYAFTCMLKTEENGELGFILDEVGKDNRIIVSIKTGEKSSITARKTGGSQDKILGKSSIPLFNGIWYKLKVVCRTNQYQVFLGDKPLFLFQMPNVTKGRLGLYSNQSKTVLFKDPIISVPEYHYPLVTCKELNQNVVQAKGWSNEQSIKLKAVPNKINKLSFNHHLINQQSSFSGTLQPGKGFKRFYLHAAGVNNIYEVNLLSYQERYFAVILYQSGEPNKEPDIKDSLKKVYQDDRNKGFKEIFRQALTDFDPKEGIPFRVTFAKAMSLEINNAQVFNHDPSSDSSYFTEIGAQGDIHIEKAELDTGLYKDGVQVYHNSLHQHESLLGKWTIFGGALDSNSMPKGTKIKFKPLLLQHGKAEIHFKNLKGKGAKFKAVFIDPINGKAQTSLNLDFSDGKNVRIKSKASGANQDQTIPYQDQFKLTLSKSGDQFSWSIDDKTVGELFRKENALSSIRLDYLSGAFLIPDLKMSQQPSHTSLFENNQRYIQDIELWGYNESFQLYNNSQAELKKQSSHKAGLLLPYEAELPKSFILHSQLDYRSLALGQHHFNFESSEGTLQLSFSSTRIGTTLSIKKPGDKEAKPYSIPTKQFHLTLYQTTKSMYLFADDQLLIKIESPGKASKLSMQITGEENHPIRLSQFAVFTDI